jgi:hypothetical protein
MWPTFVYRKSLYNVERPSNGIFKGELLVRVCELHCMDTTIPQNSFQSFRCIFTSPSSACEDSENIEDVDDQACSSKACKTTRDIRTHCNIPGLLKMRLVQPHAIAYTAVQVRVQLYCMPMETNGQGSFISHCRAALPGVSRTTILTMKYSTII